jgi:cytochrome c oxidase cbb3-type subunit III
VSQAMSNATTDDAERAARAPAATAATAAAALPRSDEEYDGIRELDNPQPRWFQLIFFGSFVFAVGYWFWYHAGGPGKSELQIYQRDYAEYRARRAAIELAEGAAVSEESLALLSADAGAMTKARAVFDQYCVSCHGPKGAGGIGPNLTDDFQLHGQSRSDIYNTVRNGVPAMGMISWTPVLAPLDLTAVAAFVGTLRHTNVAGGKAPQGVKVTPLAKPAP